MAKKTQIPDTESKQTKDQDIQTEEVKLEETDSDDTKYEQSDSETSEEQPEVSEIDCLNKEIQELTEKNLRQIAEFDNYRKRTQREKLDTYKNAAADCALNFITVFDNLERAIEAASQEESEIKKGVEMIAIQFRETLEKMDVYEIEAMEATFDPQKHNAINQVEDENYGENTICQVFQKGYRMGDKIIRPATVVVANP